MNREEIEQYIEENGTPIERMERKLRAMERDSMKRWMTVAVVAAFLAMIMAGVGIAQSARAAKAAGNAAALHQDMAELFQELKDGLVVEYERTVDEYETVTTTQSATGDTAIVNNNGTTEYHAGEGE